MNLTMQEIILAQVPRIIRELENAQKELKRFDPERRVGRDQNIFEVIGLDDRLLPSRGNGWETMADVARALEISIQKAEREIEEAKRNDYHAYKGAMTPLLDRAWRLEKSDRGETTRVTYATTRYTLEMAACFAMGTSDTDIDFTQKTLKEIRKMATPVLEKGTDIHDIGANRLCMVKIMGQLTGPLEINHEDIHVTISRNNVGINMALPTAVLMNAPGKRLCEIIDHPWTRSNELVIERVEESVGDWSSFVLKPMKLYRMKMDERDRRLSRRRRCATPVIGRSIRR